MGTSRGTDLNQNKRVLVIDDDDIAREMLCHTLKKGGFQVFELPSPIGASRLISKEKIEGVVLDVMMPSINGDKLAKLLRDGSRGSSLAIVLVSSRSPDDLRDLAQAAQVDAVITKEEARRELSLALSKACAQRRGIVLSNARSAGQT